MDLETEPQPFLDWLPDALAAWLTVCALLTLAVVGVAAVRLIVVYGLGRALDRFADAVAGFLGDLLAISPRRASALARLTIQESLRKRALAGLAVFAVILMFAIWFLDTSSIDPATLYTSFVLTATTYLVLAMVLLLSVFSLPADLKNKTIHTIVTKPVRASELVLGRLLGFVAIGTALLAIMGLCSYVFVVRALNHTHQFGPSESAGSEAAADDSGGRVRLGQTTFDQGHRHTVVLNVDGTATTDTSHGHWHPTTVDRDHGQTHYVIGSPRGQFHARVPIYGHLRFKDRAGHDARSGVNVGNEWTYRSYVEGGTLAAAVWKFDKINPQQFPEGLPLDMTIRVFRTYKGDIEKGVLGSLVLRNPRTRLTSAPRDFLAKEYSIDRHLIPRELTDSTGRSIDLFKDLVADGELEIQLDCLQRNQFFGMAQPDLYLLANEASVPLNFLKGYFGIWLQMVVITAFGVMWSTFLNGPVAMLATIGTLVGGFCSEFIASLAQGKLAGGGTFESLVRLVQHKNVLVHLDEGWGSNAVGILDAGVRWVMYLVSTLLPNLGSFSDINYVAAGFDIPPERLLVQGLVALGYALPVFLLGYLFFRSREVAL